MYQGVWVSWKIGKVEKKKKLHHKQESNKKGYIWKFTHTAQAHSAPGQTSKMESFAKITNYFRKKFHLTDGLYGGEFQLGLKFQLVKPWWDFISHVKWRQCKNRITIICKNLITVNRAEILIPCKRVEINHVIDHLTSWN